MFEGHGILSSTWFVSLLFFFATGLFVSFVCFCIFFLNIFLIYLCCLNFSGMTPFFFLPLYNSRTLQDKLQGRRPLNAHEMNMNMIYSC